ncbi:hypothetical protein N0V90_007782 [Kalmusia sp. IMI 367209]|nr:hypothetical protein N0V90_007782 [Kalmusia sp. IMI 367209]
MSPCLSHLPTELLLSILECISLFPRATPTLAALCLTSQRLRSLAEPFLYASVSNKLNTDRPHLFPLSLIGRPALADHVRKLELHTGDGDSMNPMPEDALRRLSKAIDELNLPTSLTAKHKEFLGFLGASRTAACHELSLVLASRNLETLSLQLGYKCTIGTEPISMVNHILFEGPNWAGRFDKVQSVFITPPTSNWKTDLYELAYVFKMPSLRRFEISGCKERKLGMSRGWNNQGELIADLGKWRLVENSSVESIILRHSDVGHCAINTLLNCCKAVKHLSFEVADSAVLEGWFQFFRLEDALCRHAASLEHLAIVPSETAVWHQRPHQYVNFGLLLFLSQLCKLSSAAFPLIAIPASFDDGLPGLELGSPFDEARSRTYLPPSLKGISICNGIVHYGNTDDLFRLA